MAKIRHLAIYTDDPDRLAQFYVDVFGLTRTQDLPAVPGTGRAVWISDGYKCDLSTTGLRTTAEQEQRDRAREPAKA